MSVTLNIYAEEFDKAMHRDDLMARIERAGFGAGASAVAGATLNAPATRGLMWTAVGGIGTRGEPWGNRSGWA